MKNTITLIITLILLGNYSSAQEKTLVLINKKNQDSIFINENHRIKLFTREDKKIAGQFKIINENTILIKGDTISLANIKQIKKASTFSSIASPVFATIGATFIAGGIIGLAAGGYGVLLTVLFLPGLPMFIIPLSDNEHRIEKWEYKIIQTNQSQ